MTDSDPPWQVLPPEVEIMKGLAGLVDGLLLWTVLSVLGSLELMLGANSMVWEVLVLAGFTIMLVLPLWYWVCRPIWVRWRSSEDDTKQRVANAIRAAPIAAVLVIALGAVVSGVPFAIRLH